MSSQSNKGKDDSSKPEHTLITKCRKHLNSVKQRGDVCGVAVDVFDFPDDNNPKGFKKGYVYRSATRKRISFEMGAGSKRGSINLLEPNKAIDARFMTHDISQEDKLEKMLLRSFSLKHEALLKPLICARTLSNVISGINMFNQTLIDWISIQRAKNHGRGPYLSEGEKRMIR